MHKSEPSPTLLSSNPANESTKVGLYQNINLRFDIPINGQTLLITSYPDEKWTVTNTDQKSIEVAHKSALAPYTDYLITIKNGSTTLATIAFTTIKSQSDPGLVQAIEEQMVKDYPLAKQTPLSNDAYYVVYSAPMTLEIYIKNENIIPEKAFSEIRTWVTSVGGDADAHKYVISDKPLPSITPITTSTPTEAPSPSPTPFNWDNLGDDGL